MNSENKSGFAINVTINDIAIELKNDKCNDIWTRNCPKCNKILTYNLKSNKDRHEKNLSLCSTCCRIGKPSPNKGKTYHKWKHTLNSLQKIRIARRRQIPPMLGKIRSDESKEKMRLSIVNRLEKDGVIRSYNPIACKFIDKLNIEMGFHFSHALNGGEIQFAGFFVDGYDKEKNIIFEYDEPHHYRSDGSLKKKDVERQSVIIERVNPTLFLRFNEKEKKLYNVMGT